MSNFTKFINYLILFIALFFNRLEVFLKREFDSPSIEQILFHLDFAGEKIDYDIEILYMFLKRVVLIPLFLTLSIYLIQKVFKFNLNKKLIVILNIIILTISLVLLLNRISFFDTYKHENFIDENYFPTTSIKAPTKKDNIILIYVESLENSYREISLFDKNLILSLDEHTKDWTSFSRYSQNYGGNYTIAAIVSTQCGVPLRPSTWYNKKLKKADIIGANEIGNLSEKFLPNLVCLGDILKKDGYNNIFLGGADSVFAGKGKFFKQHGYDTVMGRTEWQARGETVMNAWGLYDEMLLKNAKLELDKAYDAGKPFNLTLLTVDTHHPRGYTSPECKKRGVENFTGIVKCNVDLLTEFLKYVEVKGYMKNTNIVIMGDHLAMTNSEIEKLKSLPERTIYNKFYTLKKVTPNRDRIYQVSMFPTILEVLNYEVPNGKLGLGASGFSPTVDKNYIVEKTKADIHLTEIFRSKSELMKYFWDEAPNPLEDN